MTRADDLSLLAMQAAKMPIASIALTMGWGPERTAKRLQELNAGEEEDPAAIVPFAPAAPKLRPAPVEALDKRPLLEGEALVLVAFALATGGFGADCVLADGRRIWTVTGRDRIEPGKRIRVEQVQAADAFPPRAAVEEGAEPPRPQTGLVWRMAKAATDA